MEHDGCFSFELKAETMEDAAALTRFGLNKTKDIRHQSIGVHKDGTFTGSVVIGKKRNSNNYL